MRPHWLTSASAFFAFFFLFERRFTNAAIGTGMSPHIADTATARIALGSFLDTLQPLPPPPDEPQLDELLELPHESPLDEPQPLDDELLEPQESPDEPQPDELLLLELLPHELSQLELDELDEELSQELPLLSLEQLPVLLSLLPPQLEPELLVVELESSHEPLLVVVSSVLSQPEASPPQPDWLLEAAQPLEQVSELPQLPPLQSQFGDAFVLLLHPLPQLGEMSRGGSCDGGITPPSTPIGLGNVPFGAP